MRVVVGILCLAAWLLYLGQIITVANFGLAQRLGLQETSDHADPLFSHVELWAARWDLWWLWTLPVAGILMLIDHSWWPYAAMIGGGAFVDAGGREAAKIFGLREQGVGQFLDMHDVGDAAVRAGLRDPVLDVDRVRTDAAPGCDMELIYGHCWGPGPQSASGEYRIEPMQIGRRRG